jgi:hypothetical protein
MLWLTLLFQTRLNFPMEGCHCSFMKQIPYSGKDPKGFPPWNQLMIKAGILPESPPFYCK